MGIRGATYSRTSVAARATAMTIGKVLEDNLNLKVNETDMFKTTLFVTYNGKRYKVEVFEETGRVE